MADKDEMDSIAVVDVTAEMIGERRQDWHDGVDAGMKTGARRVLESDALAAVAAEVLMLRTLIDAMTEAAHQREKVIDWYRSKYIELVRHIRERANERWGPDA